MADGDSAGGRPSRRRGLWIALLVIAGVGLGYRYRPEPSRAESPPERAQPAVPKVRVATAALAADTLTITQTGTTQPFDAASIYPRATGYIVERKVDIGSHVKKGDLLFRISAPDLDQQLVQAQSQVLQLQASLVQAQAMVDQAEANRRLADQTNRRTSTLASTGIATQQNADSSQAGVLAQGANVSAARAAVKVAEANIEAQQAQVGRLTVLTRFEEIRAPFDGLVTTRNNDVGDAVTADVTTGSPILTLARDDVLRMAVNVPSMPRTGSATGWRPGSRWLRSPGRSFRAVSRGPRRPCSTPRARW